MKLSDWKLNQQLTEPPRITAMDTFDTAMMARALQLARRGQYSAMPNPHVGCVLVRNGNVIGEGFTCPAGGITQRLRRCDRPVMRWVPPPM
jgi:deoxycytidylate deaminase